MTEFKPTHEINTKDGRTIPVQLVDGALYTRAEWDASDAADWSLDADGGLVFQGQPVDGSSFRRL